MTTRQVCDDCATEYADTASDVECSRCGGLLSIQYDTPAVKGQALRQVFEARYQRWRPNEPAEDTSGVWRFRELVMPEASGDEIVSQREGNTPLLASDAVARWSGANRLLLKHEGYNPTGSFKDRGMAVAVTQARRIGAPAVLCASTGNTSSSLAAYAALEELPALVLVPAGQVSMGKLAQTLAYGARTLVVHGDFDACLRLAREAAARLGMYLANSVNPFRLAGQKTILLELFAQMSWVAPEWIVLPAGNLGNTAAFGFAIREALALGLIDRRPRLAAVQASGAAPFAASFRNDFRARETVSAETIATAIRIGNPASYSRAVRSIRETNGVVLDVSDDEILEAKAIVDGAGVGCEPASAASVAGVRQLVRQGQIGRDDRVVALLTGHILKDTGALLDYHDPKSPNRPGVNPPREIPATLSALEDAFRALKR